MNRKKIFKLMSLEGGGELNTKTSAWLRRWRALAKCERNKKNS